MQLKDPFHLQEVISVTLICKYLTLCYWGVVMLNTVKILEPFIFGNIKGLVWVLYNYNM